MGGWHDNITELSAEAVLEGNRRSCGSVVASRSLKTEYRKSKEKKVILLTRKNSEQRQTTYCLKLTEEVRGAER